MGTRLRFTPLGGAQEIGANSYHLELDGFPLLLDAGMHPKKTGTLALPLFDSVSSSPVDAILVSHCHLDHLGALPEALRRNPHAAIYLTTASTILAPKMLANMASVMRLRARQNGEPRLYKYNEVEMVSQLLQGEDFATPFAVQKGLGGEKSSLTATFHHAGHIVGAAGIELRSGDFSFFYTGDTCAADQPIIPGAYYPEGPIDVLLMECTAGADEEAENRDRKKITEEFASAISRVIAREGVVLVPSFALGRTQEMLKTLHDLQEQGSIPNVPLYVSGMGKVVSQVYDATRYDSKRSDPEFRLGSIGFSILSRDNVKKPEILAEPCIILATSGMMHPYTPSNILVRSMLPNPKNGIFFVGYLDPDAPGYQVLHAKPDETLCLEEDGEEYPVKAEIKRFHFSAHSHRQELIRMVGRVRPKRVILVHGGRRSLAWMHDAIQNLPDAPEILVPEPGVSYEIEKP